jgi:ABC-type multidrug transport system fused ATPase/permease subunit
MLGEGRKNDHRGGLILLLELARPRWLLLLCGFALMLVNRLCAMVMPVSSKFLIDNIVGPGNWRLLTPLTFTIIGATVFQGATSFTLTQSLAKEAQRLIAILRCRLQEHISRLPLSYHDTNKTGALISRIMNDVDGVRYLIGAGLVDFGGGLLTALLSVAYLFWLSPFLTLLALFFMTLFALGVGTAFRQVRPIFRQHSKTNGEIYGRLSESLAGVRVVKGYHAEAHEARVFAAGVQRLLRVVLKLLTTSSLIMLSATMLAGLVGASVMYVGARQIYSHSLTLGGFISFTTSLAFLIAPMYQAVAIATQVAEALAGLDRAHELLQEKPEDEDPRRTESLATLRGQVSFQNVGFAYSNGQPVLFDISFEAEPGTVTALVGPSGAGKSTLISMIAAFHAPTTGVVRVDGIDLATVRLGTYRTRLGIILQDPFLFDGTIRDNVAFARPDTTEEQIQKACRIARVDEFAETFEQKYDTVVGERGVKVSGGQRQRMAIARAIVADPRILILDEATSSLDSESEAIIQEGLAYVMEGRTTFVIAHRLSTIRRADQILVLEAGQIVERGTHESLYARKGRYYDLYTRQHGMDARTLLAPGESDETRAGDEGQQLTDFEAGAVRSILRVGIS